MFTVLFLVALTGLTQLSGGACFKFHVTRDLNNFKELERAKWIEVEVTRATQTEEEEDANGKIAVKFDIHQSLPHSDVFVFFANNAKEILQVNLNSKIEGKFYSIPYKLSKQLKGEDATKAEKGEFYEISGTFPASWLPNNTSKISAAVVGPDGQYYNSYKMQNFDISIPDLMVVEEYKPFVLN